MGQISFAGMRKDALTTGVQPMSMATPTPAIAGVPGAASSSSASSSGRRELQSLQRGNSLLRFETFEDDDLNRKDRDPDIMIVVAEPSQPSSASASRDPSSSSNAMSKPTKPSGANALCVFKLVHKNPAGMKRPLSAVDNLRSDDIAIREYDVVWNDSWHHHI